MKYIVTPPQLSLYIRRRFSSDMLNAMVQSVKKKIDDGHNVMESIYDVIRHYISLYRLDVNDEGSEEEYWDSYSQYETPLVEYIKYSLNLN
jgi:hypothetical protein